MSTSAAFVVSTNQSAALSTTFSGSGRMIDISLFNLFRAVLVFLHAWPLSFGKEFEFLALERLLITHLHMWRSSQLIYDGIYNITGIQTLKQTKNDKI